MYGQIFKQHNTVGSVTVPVAAQNLVTGQYAKENRVPGIGQVVTFGDGRAYVWCTTNANIAAGRVVAVNPALDTEFAAKLAVAAAGATEVVLDVSSISFFGVDASNLTRNALSGGYLTISDQTGEGYSYQIKGNAAAASDSVTIQLMTPLIAAIDATTDCHVNGSVYRKVIAGGAAELNIGVATVATTASTAGEEQGFWVQVSGMGVVSVAATTSINAGVPLGVTSTAGQVVVATAVLQTIAIAAGTPAAANAHCPAWIKGLIGATHA